MHLSFGYLSNQFKKIKILKIHHPGPELCLTKYKCCVGGTCTLFIGSVAII